MGALWTIVQRHIDAQPYGASLRGVAGKLGMSPTALSNWRDLKAMPSPAYLRALADLTGTAYSRVLEAALEDAGYYERPGGPDDSAPIATHDATETIDPAADGGGATGSGSSRGSQYGDARVHGRSTRGTGRARGRAHGTSGEGG